MPRIISDVTKRALYARMLDQPIRQRGLFQIELSEKLVASVTYEGTNVINLLHSEIPEELQGYGFGHILAEVICYHINNMCKSILTSTFFYFWFSHLSLNIYKTHNNISE